MVPVSELVLALVLVVVRVPVLVPDWLVELMWVVLAFVDDTESVCRCEVVDTVSEPELWVLRDVAELWLVPFEVLVWAPSVLDVDPVCLVVPERLETVCVALDPVLILELELAVPVRAVLVPELELAVPVCVVLVPEPELAVPVCDELD